MRWHHILLATFVAAIWGANFTFIKIGLVDFPPIFLSAARFLLVAIPAVFLLPRPRISFLRIVQFGVVLGVAKFSFLFIGMQQGISAGLASIVLQTQVFFTILLSALLAGEKPTASQLAGTVLGFTGVTLISFSSLAGIAPQPGLFLVIMAAFSWAVANLLFRSSGTANMISLIVWASLVSAPLLFAMSFYFEDRSAIYTAVVGMDIKSVAILIYLAGFSTLLAYAIWGSLLVRFPASKVVPFALLVPVFGVFTGALVLSEEVSRQTLWAGALVISGLSITNFGPAASRRLTGSRLYRNIRGRQK